MTLASAPRSITLRGAAGAEVVLSGDTGARGFRGLWWHSGVSTKPLLGRPWFGRTALASQLLPGAASTPLRP